MYLKNLLRLVCLAASKTVIRQVIESSPTLLFRCIISNIRALAKIIQMSNLENKNKQVVKPAIFDNAILYQTNDRLTNDT